MARKATRAAQGAGSIRQRKDGLWEGRYTVGRDPGTGKPIRKSVYGQTQKAARQKLAQAVAAVDRGEYVEPQKMTVGAWLDTWRKDYLVDLKPYTVSNYDAAIRKHIRPALGAVKLERLSPHMIQGFYNSLAVERDGKPALSANTIRHIHAVLRNALQQAVKIGYIKQNPAEACVLPKIQHTEIMPLDEDGISAFLQAIKGERFEALFTVALFTGMRRGELLGLMWDCVDLEAGTICIDKQLQQGKKNDRFYTFTTPKSGKARTITAAPWVVDFLKQHRRKQLEMRLKAGAAWEDSGLVFTDELGHHLAFPTVYAKFKEIAASIGRPEIRLHDLRHSYAVASIRAGDDIKTVQGNLGHASAAFTLDIYGHVTDRMKQDSAARMDGFIKGVLAL